MEFNFPLILMLATFFTGLMALLDKFWLASKRAKKVQQLKEDFADEVDIEKAQTESFIVEQSKSFFPVLLVVFVLRSFIAEPFQIPSGSMEPGLTKGDFILVNKFAYGLRMPVFDFTIVPIGLPQRGDVMVFFPPNDPRYFIKRVIGLPGDHVVYQNKQLRINGKVIATVDSRDQPYPATKHFVREELGSHQARIQWTYVQNQNQETILYNGPEGEWFVPEGHYFTMGDNRGNSADSRYWGFVPEKNIVGKAEAIWLHMESLGSMPSFSRNGWID